MNPDNPDILAHLEGIDNIAGEAAAEYIITNYLENDNYFEINKSTLYYRLHRSSRPRIVFT